MDTLVTVKTKTLMTVKYAPRPGAPFGAEQAQTVGETLEYIANRDGQVTPQAVVDNARDKQSPLHGYFDWNNKTAAEAYRMEQARHLIRGVRIIKGTSDDGNVPVFSSITRRPEAAEDGDAAPAERYYLRTAEVVDDEELRLQSLQSLTRRICGYRDQLALHPECKQSGLLAALDKLERLVQSSLQRKLKAG